MDLGRDRFAVRDLLQRGVDGEDVVPDAFLRKNRNDPLHAFGSPFQDVLYVLLTDLLTVVAVRHADHLGKDDGIHEIHRHDVSAVHDRDARVKNVFFLFRRDQMDADRARTVRIQRGVQDFVEHQVHVLLDLPDRFGLAE